MITAKMLLLFYDTMAREKRHILSELVQVNGLMPLLMKPRNYRTWTQLTHVAWARQYIPAASRRRDECAKSKGPLR